MFLPCFLEQLMCCHLKAVDEMNDSDHSNSIIGKN